MLIFRTFFIFVAVLFFSQSLSAQNSTVPDLPDSETMLLTVFLKHIQTMNNDERKLLTDKTGWSEMFPPEDVEIVDHYVMMGIGQVLVLKLPPEKLRAVNVAIERGAWGAYETEFYITYDLAKARAAQKAR
ncbi:hypothetical protein N9W89_01290 [Hellea sp.]|nr:hypothetical protein [Hellea sp.]